MSLGADSLLLAASFGVFGLKLGETVLLTLLGGLSSGLSGELGVRVESLHKSLVLQWVLSGRSLNNWVSSNITELVLNLVGVDDSGKISAGHHTSVKLVTTLLNTLLSVGTENVVQGLESIGSEDDESAEVTTWGKLEEVESVDIASVNTWQVAGGSSDIWVLVTVNNEWTLSHLEAVVSHLVETSTGSLGGTDSSEVLSDANGFEGSEESLGGVNVKGVNNEWELWDGVNVVTSGKDEWGNGGSSQSGGNSVSLLVGVDLSVPSSPDLEWGEHATLSAHVTESGLTGTGGTGATNSWNTSDGSTSTPGLSGVLLTSLIENSVGLTSVLGHVGVDELDGVISDWGSEDSWHWHLLLLFAVNAHNGSCSHLFFRIDK